MAMRALKEAEWDFYRWLIYGFIALVLALAAIAFPVLIWGFAIVLIIAVIDIFYTKYTKYQM
jgi:hypothetical protein